MLKFLASLLPLVAAVPTCLKQATLGKDPFLPAPSMYVGSWGSCAAECQKSMICKEFAYKEDTVPTKGGCWLFNKVDVDFQEDPKAVTGDKSCQDPEVTAPAAPAAAALAVPPAPEEPVKASIIVPAAPAITDATVAPLPALSASADAAVDAAADAVGQGLAPEGGQKAMVAGEGAGQDHTVLYCMLGGGAAAALIAAGGYFMMPGTRKKRKRGVQSKRPAAPSPEMQADLIAEEAPAEVSTVGSGAGLDMGLQMQAPNGYLPLPQGGGFVPSQFQYSQGQYMAYQPGTFQTYQPMTYQPVVYQQPMGPVMEPTTYMPSTSPA